MYSKQNQSNSGLLWTLNWNRSIVNHNQSRYFWFLILYQPWPTNPVEILLNNPTFLIALCGWPISQWQCALLADQPIRWRITGKYWLIDQSGGKRNGLGRRERRPKNKTREKNEFKNRGMGYLTVCSSLLNQRAYVLQLGKNTDHQLQWTPSLRWTLSGPAPAVRLKESLVTDRQLN